jgi:outer membrane protein TolC
MSKSVSAASARLSLARRTKIVAAALGLLAGATNLPAQQAGYRLSSLLDSAQRHLPILMAKRAALNGAKANVADARHSFLPQLLIGDQVDLSTLNAVEGVFFPLNAIPSTTSGVRSAGQSDLASGNVGAVYGQVELLNFGLTSARVGNAEAQVEVGRADLDRESYLAKGDVARLFFDLAKAQSRLGVEQQNVSRYEEVFRIQQALTSSGIRAGVDSSMAKAELSRARTNLNEAVGAIAQLKMRLSALTGITADRLVIDTTGLQYSPIGTDSAARIAASHKHPLLDYYYEQEQLRQSDERLAGKSYLPKLLIGGGAWARGSSINFDDVYGPLGSGLGLQRVNYGLGIALAYDIVGVVHRHDKMEVARWRADAADFELQQQQLDLRLAASQADEAIRTSETNLAEFPIQLDAARDTYSQKVAQYQAGLINLIDLTNAAFVLYRSQNDYLSAVNDWYVARIDKAIASGTLDVFIQSLR